MAFPIVSIINETINSNLNRRAVSYYNGEKWYDESFAILKERARIVQSLLNREIAANKTQYVLLHLNITFTYPAIILGVLNADHGFLCVEPGKQNLIGCYNLKFPIKYIISNIFCNESYQTLFPSNTSFSQSFNLGREIVGLWHVGLSDEYLSQKIPFMYAIETSGTTGAPKSVQVHHDSIYPNIKDLSSILQITNTDVILLMTPLTFDPSVVELFLALMNGCTLCIVTNEIKQNPNALLDVLFPSIGGLISILQTTPSLFRRWNPIDIKKRLFSEKSLLRCLILGGEEFPSIKEVKSWYPPETISIYNIYGLTEISCWASINKVWPAREIETDIGKPLSEMVMKLNEDIECEGELLIGSKTRKCLINDENVEIIFENNKEIFRATGDIFKNINGKLYFQRRKDDIMKRWGVQFRTSSIEKIAKLHHNVLSCICSAVRLDEHIRIGLFVIEKNMSDLKDLKSYLKKYLSRVSWPDTVIDLNSFPLTPHGKVCLRTLNKMLLSEKKNISKDLLMQLWEHYSSKNSISSSDFFSVGGDSFTALQFTAELKLFYHNIPDTILGVILQKKSFNEVWEHLHTHKENLQTEIYQENITRLLEGTKQEIVTYKDKIERHDSTEKIITVYLKGKMTTFIHKIKQIPEKIMLKHVKFHQRWKYDLRKCVDASPLGVSFKSDRHICIVGSHSGRIAVLEVETGSLISECILPNRVESSACISHDAEFYYIGCYDGCVYCVKTECGKIIWKFKTEDMIKSSCIIFEECIIFGSYDKNIYCLNKVCSLKWKTLLKSPILAEPVLNDMFVYCGTLGSVAAMNVVTGQLLWELKSEPVFSTPFFNNNLLVVAVVSGSVRWLNSKNGEEEYLFKVNDMIFSSLVNYSRDGNENIIFGCQDGSVYCLVERQLYWKTVLDSRIISTPFLKYCEENSTGYVICSSTKGTIFVLNLESGEKQFQHTLPGEVFSSPIVMKNNKLIVGCRDNNVYCLDIK